MLAEDLGNATHSNLRRGAKVVVNDLGGNMDGTGGSSEAAESVVKEIKAAGGEAIANGGSVSDRAGALKYGYGRYGCLGSRGYFDK